MEKSYIVYKHTNLINNKIYIGITKYGNCPEKRWRNGLGYEYNEKFFSDIIKYGWNNFSHEILDKNLDLIEASILEKKYIEEYDSIISGYNYSAGGNAPSDEGCQRISQALTGIKRKQSSIEKQMTTKQERYGTGRGKQYQGTRNKIVKCNETGDIFISAADAGRWAGTSKISMCCNGQRKYAGRHPETGQKLSWIYIEQDVDIDNVLDCQYQLKPKKTIKKIQCIETQKIYENASEAFRETGISVSNILRVCKGERKTAGKLHWIYYEEE